MATVEERLAAAIGLSYLEGPQLTETEFRKLLNSSNELPNGDYNLGIAQKLTNYIIRDMRQEITDLKKQIAALETRPSGSVSTTPPEQPTPQPQPTPAPAPSAGTIPPLSAAQQTALFDALQRGVGRRLEQAFVDKIKSDVSAGRYAICDADTIGTIKGWFYDDGATPPDRHAIAPYLFTIIDQRDPDQPNVTMSPDDPRVKQVSGSASTTPTGSGTLTASALNSVLNQFDMYIAKDPETGRSILSMGRAPDFDCQSPLQIGGKFAAEIAGYSDTMRVEGQGSGSHDSCNTFVIADGDGGMRWRQYLKWGKRGKIRNTLTRPATILALDSVGELCCSQEPIGSNEDGGQNWYIKMDWARKLIRFLPFKPGWKPTIEACSTNYGDADIKLL